MTQPRRKAQGKRGGASSRSGGANRSGGGKPAAKRSTTRASTKGSARASGAAKAKAKSTGGSEPKSRRAAKPKSAGAAKPKGQTRAKGPPRAKGRAAATPAEGVDISAKTVAELREALSSRMLDPLGLVMLTRERIEEAVEDAVTRGRVTAADAQDLVGGLLERGRKQTNDVLADL